jgi:hypothetical protein
MLKVRILYIIAAAFILFQVLGYIGSENVKPVDNGSVHVIAFYIGYNFFLLIGIILLVIAYLIRKKIKRKAGSDLVEPVGKEKDGDL